MSFRRRIFPEVLESLLTSLTGGVAAESAAVPAARCDTASVRQRVLQQPPAADVVSVWGTVGGEPHVFRKERRLLSSPATAARSCWAAQGAEYPGPGHALHVNYVPAAAQPTSPTCRSAACCGRSPRRPRSSSRASTPCSRASTSRGSSTPRPTRARQRGRPARDRAGARRPPGRRGRVRARRERVRRDHDPRGHARRDRRRPRRVRDDRDGDDAAGQSSIRVVARDLEPNDPLPADALTLLPVPVAGIASVTNPAPTAIVGRDESDDELRTRAKNVLHGSERATIGAIQQAIHGAGITADIDEGTTPGIVRITPHAESMPPDLQQRLLSSLERGAAGGRRPRSSARRRRRGRSTSSSGSTTASGLLAQDLRAAQRSVRDEVTEFFAAAAGARGREHQPARRARVLGVSRRRRT